MDAAEPTAAPTLPTPVTSSTTPAATASSTTPATAAAATAAASSTPQLRTFRPDPTWYRRLGGVVGALAGVSDMDGVVDVVVRAAADALDASLASLSVVDAAADEIHLLGLRGGAPGTAATWASRPLSAPILVCDALRARRPILLRGTAEIAAAYPDLRLARQPTDNTLLCLPLVAGDRPVGAVALQFPGLWSADPAQHDFLSIFADSCAQAIERVQALRVQEQAQATLSFLSQASMELASSLDHRATLSRVVDLAVPTLGDWCAVQLWEDGALHTVAVTHRDPAKIAMARELQTRYPPRPDAPTGTLLVAMTGRSELYPAITDEMIVAGAQDDDHLRLTRALELRSLLIVPLATRGRVLGTLTLASSESRRRYDERDLDLAEDLARRAALAIDNAQLHSQTREVALRLQHAVLPGPLDDLEGWEVATRYRPAGRTEVGGDFYDAVTLPDGRVVVVVGDVMGRGVTAAAAMAQVRSAIRAYLASGPDPDTVLFRLHAMFARYGIDRLVTVLIALVDAERGRVRVANAGHLPPVVVTADGVARVLAAEPASPPLGAAVPPRDGRTWDFPPDATLLLYTDGLVERRDEDLGRGIDRLRARSTRLAGAPDLLRALTELVDDVTDSRRDDDLTVLALRRDPRPEADRGATTAPTIDEWCEVDNPGAARSWITDVLGRALPPFPEPSVDDAQMVISELVTNSLRAGCSSVRVHLVVGRQGVRLGVLDDAGGLPRLTAARADETHGRGLAIVAALADEWGVDPLGDGKEVWARLRARTRA